VTLPFNNVKWVIVNQLATNVTTLSASADWNSMKDKPVIVDPAMPTS
jgi:hypothetical protein